MKILQSRFIVMFFLIIIFIAPSVLAYLYYRHPTWLSSPSTNRGELVTPPYQLQNISQSQRWRLLFWSPSTCDATCIQRLNALARIRLALGRRLYQVQACVLLPDKKTSFRLKDTKILQEDDICVLKLPEQAQADRSALGDNPMFFIVNPDGFFILKYPADMQADDLFHDIKHLLTEPSSS